MPVAIKVNAGLHSHWTWIHLRFVSISECFSLSFVTYTSTQSLHLCLYGDSVANSTVTDNPDFIIDMPCTKLSIIIIIAPSLKSNNNFLSVIVLDHWQGRIYGGGTMGAKYTGQLFCSGTVAFVDAVSDKNNRHTYSYSKSYWHMQWSDTKNTIAIGGTLSGRTPWAGAHVPCSNPAW